jgi:hypothetical protein
MSDEPKGSKPARVALTKTQAAEGLGLELVKLASGWLEDGKLSESELEALKDWLKRCPTESIPAVRFLREEVQHYFADGRLEDWKLDRLFSSLARVIPPAERAGANEARKKSRKAQEKAERPAREAKRAAAFKESRAYWLTMQQRYGEEWAGEPASEAQLEYIRELGGSLPERASKLDASRMIDSLLSREGSGGDALASKVLGVLVVIVLLIVVIVSLCK